MQGIYFQVIPKEKNYYCSRSLRRLYTYTLKEHKHKIFVFSVHAYFKEHRIQIRVFSVHAYFKEHRLQIPVFSI